MVYKISCYMGLQYATIYLQATCEAEAISRALLIPGVVEARLANY